MMHGQLYNMKEKPIPTPPVHKRCRCEIKPIDMKYAGTASNNGRNGADWWIATYNQLPGQYVTYDEAIEAGGIPWTGNLNLVLPGCIIGGDVYKNRNGHLPQKGGRVWYEADINYNGGYRGNARIVFSNDGLIFATYDHYQTFVEIL